MGGLVLNRQAGGLNPVAVERCGQAGGTLFMVSYTGCPLLPVFSPRT
ncbi:DUF6282 family protein [[Clostridium] symbiosum]